MRTAPPRRFAGMAIFVICLLLGVGLGLAAGGLQNVFLGALAGPVAGLMARDLALRYERLPRQALFGGALSFALMVTVHVLWLRAAVGLVLLPGLALGAFYSGTLLTASPLRHRVLGALLGALPMPLMGLVANAVGAQSRLAIMLIDATLTFAWLAAIFGWIADRSLSRLPWQALGGAIFGLAGMGACQIFMLVMNLDFSTPIRAAELTLTSQLMTGVSACTGAWLGAIVGRGYILPKE
ncbi:MAG TPA: hypothetical protein VD886_02730 [Herpetosiphonaceae bacterium]|nr:hypothetical protein [Herpetosiphonaceae bacterium]